MKTVITAILLTLSLNISAEEVVPFTEKQLRDITAQTVMMKGCMWIGKASLNTLK